MADGPGLGTATAAADKLSDPGTGVGFGRAIGTVSGMAVLKDSGGSSGNSDHGLSLNAVDLGGTVAFAGDFALATSTEEAEGPSPLSSSMDPCSAMLADPFLVILFLALEDP